MRNVKLLRNRVIAAIVTRVASEQTFNGHYAPTERAMGAKGVFGIAGTTGIKPTGSSQKG